jgi:Fe-Mn family superoxide dismutase
MTQTASNKLSRRDALSALAVGSAALATSAVVHAQAKAPQPAAAHAQPPAESKHEASGPSALAGSHVPIDLPFKPGSLHDISERMIVSHHDNNYVGAVKNLNRTEQELAHVTKDTAPFVVAGLRQSELQFRNSKRLHEAYFANLGGNGKRAGAVEAGLAQAYGSAARWEEHFRATAAGLGGGSGWVILGYELDSGQLRTFWSGNHTQAPVDTVPVLVMDMYEHAYQIDFGAAAARYIDAFFNNIQWDAVNQRYERAQNARRALQASA